MSTAHNSKTVLLAEDEEAVRTFAYAVLSNCGYQIIVAIDGLEALEKARQHTGEIHLLLSNIQMPNMTGIELATQLQLERPDVKVLLMSGLPAGLLVLDGGWQFLPKPFMAKMLKEKIALMLCEADRKALPEPR